jgi:hypothetical protein
MALSPVMPAPAPYALAPGASPRPDMMQGAGTLALATSGRAVAPQMDYGSRIDVDYHTARVEAFEASEEAQRENRKKAERDIDYYDNRQLTEEEFKALQKRGQPPISLNMIRQRIDFLQGLERTQRTKPRALPRTKMHEQDAEAVGDALVFICDDNRYSKIRSKVWKDILTAGWGGVEITAEERRNPSQGTPSHKVLARRCQWDRMWWDPYSCEDDFSDANHLGMVLWMDREAAVRQYGDDAGKVFDETISIASSGETLDDKPKTTTWIQQGKRQRIRVIQAYFIADDGEWDFCEFTKGGVLKAGPSPWLDEQGMRVHPYEWRACFVDRDNNRYGVVRDLIDPQDEINKRRSKSLHLFTARQTFGTETAAGGMSVKMMREQLAKPDGHIQLGPSAEWGKNFGVIPTGDQAAGHFELLQQVMGVFETMGPNASMMGKGSGAQSGRAIQANQQGGSVQVGTQTDTLKDLDYGAYRKMWNGVRQFWTGETWIRVTDDEKNLKWVGLNSPKMQQIQTPDGQTFEQPEMDPMTGQPVIENNVAEIDVDIIIDDAPDMGSLQDEQFALLVQLKSMDQGGEIPFKAIIAAAPGLRNKAEMLTAISEREQQPDPVKQADVQTTLADRQAGTAQKLANAKLAEAKAAKEMVHAHMHVAQPILDAAENGEQRYHDAMNAPVGYAGAE